MFESAFATLLQCATIFVASLIPLVLSAVYHSSYTACAYLFGYFVLCSIASQLLALGIYMLCRYLLALELPVFFICLLVTSVLFIAYSRRILGVIERVHRKQITDGSKSNYPGFRVTFSMNGQKRFVDIEAPSAKDAGLIFAQTIGRHEVLNVTPKLIRRLPSELPNG